MKAWMFISHIESSIPHIKDYIFNVYLPKLNSALEGLSVQVGEPDEAAREPYSLILVASGGPTSDFHSYYEKAKGPFVILTTEYDNSLGCALEIKSYLDNRGEASEILYGSVEDVASRLNQINRAIMARERISKMRFGLIGCSSCDDPETFDEADLEDSLGVSTKCIPMEEFISEIGRHAYEKSADTEMLLDLASDKEEMEKALCVYGALSRIIGRNGFNAVAVRCFELLDIKVTSCIALALLNKEGIYAACEGDMRSLVSMVILGEVSGQHVFMANPSQADRRERTVVFAHCTLPLDMAGSFELKSHFESGLSVAVKGHFEDDAYTVFKCKEDLCLYHVKRGDFVGSPSEELLCRSQLKLSFDESGSFFDDPINNHQMICRGDHTKAIEEFFRWV